MQTKLENLCLSDKTVVEILSDDDTEEQITNALVEENIINDSYLNKIEIIEKTLYTYGEKTNDTEC